MTSPKTVARGRWVERAGRVGLIAKGISFALVGVLALDVAFDGGGSTPDRQGALRRIAEGGIGRAALIALAIGFAGYAAWRLAQALFDRGGEGDDPPGLAKRALAFGMAAIYVALTATAVSILADAGGASGNEEDKWTARVLDLPAGRWLVAAAGLVILGVGLFNGWRAFTGGFEKHLETWEISDAERPLVLTVGFLGHAARMLVFGLIGLFLVKAALDERARETVGFDGALQHVAQQSYGRLLLGLLAAGVFAYGLFCFVEARYRRV